MQVVGETNCFNKISSYYIVKSSNILPINVEEINCCKNVFDFTKYAMQMKFFPGVLSTAKI